MDIQHRITGEVYFVTLYNRICYRIANLKNTRTGIANPSDTAQLYMLIIGISGRTEDLKTAAINTLVSVGTSKLTNASSNKALKEAENKVVKANNNVSTAERRLARSTNSTSRSTNLSNARSAAQQARNAQVGTKILNSTVGQVNEKAAQQTISTANNRVQREAQQK